MTTTTAQPLRRPAPSVLLATHGPSSDDLLRPASLFAAAAVVLLFGFSVSPSSSSTRDDIVLAPCAVGNRRGLLPRGPVAEVESS